MQQKGFAPIAILVGVLILAVGGYFLYINQQKSTPITQQFTQSTTTPNQYDKEQAFWKAHDAKYPKPSQQPIPSDLEDELFNAFNKDPIALRATGGQGWARYNFSMQGYNGKYYGDVAVGGVGHCKNPPTAEGANKGCGGGAEWVMNKKDNGTWIVIYLGQQAYDDCENLKHFLNDLEPWQGVCWDDKRKGLVDILHPNESYNNY